jgi:hypothetical protein
MVAGIRYYPGFVTVEPWWLERGNPVFVTTLV